MLSNLNKGVVTALITPFNENLSIDLSSFEKILDKQIKGQVAGVVVNGTTGESPNIEEDELEILIKTAKLKLSGTNIPLIVGCGTNSTKTTIKKANLAQNFGAEALLIVTPYYNRPTQSGLIAHYREIAKNTDLPIILYTVKTRTGVDLEDESVIELAKLANIVGIKDGSGDNTRPGNIEKHITKKFIQFSGDDSFALAFNASCDSHGVISVASNLVPELVSRVQRLWFEGNISEAIKLQNHLMSLYKILFCETNPSPIKYAMSKIGLCHEYMRLPLVPPTDKSKARIDEVLEKLSLI